MLKAALIGIILGHAYTHYIDYSKQKPITLGNRPYYTQNQFDFMVNGFCNGIFKEYAPLANSEDCIISLYTQTLLLEANKDAIEKRK